MWLARSHSNVPRIIADYPKHRFIFLTLTARNCPLTELRQRLAEMSKAWERLSKRKQFPADGWLRNVEVTRGKDDYAHPHYHALLMVKPSYFGGDYYLSQKKWTALWRQSMRLDYDPIVHVQVIKQNYAHTPQTSTQADSSYAHKPVDLLEVENGNVQTVSTNVTDSSSQLSNDLWKAIRYCVKYQTKSESFASNAHTSEINSEWLIEYTKQIHKTRAIALGGIFKQYMSEADPEDLIHAEVETDVDADIQEDKVVANWHQDAKQYVMSDADLHDYNICLEVERRAEEFERHQKDYPIAKPASMRTVLTK